ncbi:MAG: hypothetical protein L0H53_01640 [Candidatus Nitrosocosmicus sp.]|nr:hypothetical protein [Candidatus Nitrosocosmicus sp.]MDN5867989.1 hypothetical protein [Candidatus Nitrosocosmicus sp.]
MDSFLSVIVTWNIAPDKDQNFLYYLIVHSLLNKIFSLSIFVALVLSTFLAYHILNEIQSVSATTVSSKDQLMPFDMEIFELGHSQNETVENSSNIVTDDTQDKTEDCEMPPCPPGQACIQSCP